MKRGNRDNLGMIFSILMKTCFYPSLDQSRQDGSNEWSKHTFHEKPENYPSIILNLEFCSYT